MDTTDIKTARSRRAKREAADAKKEARALAANAANKAQDDAAAERKARTGTAAAINSAPKPRLTKAEQRRIAQEAAEQQARRDAALKPEPVPDDYQPGDPVPLHVLNQRRIADREAAKAEAMEVGAKVGNFTRQLLTGTEHIGNRGSRHQRMFEADERMRRAQAEAAALKKD